MFNGLGVRSWQTTRRSPHLYPHRHRRNSAKRLNAITASVTRSYSYDSAGNTTSDGSATYACDDAGRMTSATKAGVTSMHALNGLGQRVRKTTAGTSIYFVHYKDGHLVGEYDSSCAARIIQARITADARRSRQGCTGANWNAGMRSQNVRFDR